MRNQRVRRISRVNRRPRRNLTNSNVFKRRVQNVSNRPVLKPRKSTFGNLTFNTFRRLIAYPAKKSKWWLDELEWHDSLPMQLHTVKAGTKAYVIGCGSTVLFTLSSLLSTAPICCHNNQDIFVGYEQARIMFIRFTVTPIVNVADRSGVYACGIAATSIDETVADASNDFRILSQQPNSVVRPMTRPISVSWSPTLQEHAIQWEPIQGSKPVCALMIAFSDLALTKADTDGSEYNPAKASFEILVESRIEIRRPGTSKLTNKLVHSNPRLMQIRRKDHLEYVSLDDVDPDTTGYTLREGAVKIVEFDLDNLAIN